MKNYEQPLICIFMRSNEDAIMASVTVDPNEDDKVWMQEADYESQFC